LQFVFYFEFLSLEVVNENVVGVRSSFFEIDLGFKRCMLWF